MPLRPTEALKCQACEQLSQLHALRDVEIIDGEVKPYPGNKVLGRCPHCDELVTSEMIC